MVFLGAAVGAPVRYLVDRALRHSSGFPLGTLVVNVAGSFLLGLVGGSALLGTGFCGGLTTYSTFSYETVRLVEQENYRMAALNALGSLALGVSAAALGLVLSGALQAG